MRHLFSLVAVAAILVACGSGANPGPGTNATSGESAPAAKPSGATGPSNAAPAGGPPSTMVQAAAQEGTLELYTPSSLEKTAAAEIVDAFNRHYGLHVD